MKKILILMLILMSALELSALDINMINYKNISLGIDYDEIRLSNKEKIIPVYTEFRYHFPLKSNYKPFIKSELGFNFIEEEKDGEEVEDLLENNYYGVGAGIHIKGVVMELMYISYNLAYEKDYSSISEDRFQLKVKYNY